MAEKMASSEPSGQAEGLASEEEHSDDGDATSTRDESIKTTDKPNDVRSHTFGPIQLVYRFMVLFILKRTSGRVGGWADFTIMPLLFEHL